LVNEHSFIIWPMTPRPRTVSDAQILAAAGRVLGRVGPAKLTLALIGQEAGLAPATLLQRFGSKRGLLLALGKRSQGEEGGAPPATLRQDDGSPLVALRGFLLCFARMARSPDELAHHLAAYQMDIVDPELRRITRAIGRQHEATVARLLAESVAAGELRECSPAKLAPVLLALVQGSLLGWAVVRKGSARAWLARHLGTALEPYSLP
jgi:AcrR family transcriptional regulator